MNRQDAKNAKKCIKKWRCAMEDIPQLLVGGMQVGAAVLVIVQALKAAGLARTEAQAQAANLVVSLLLGAAWAATQFWPQLEPGVRIVIVALAGSLASGLGYRGIQALRRAG
jgi:hypothetical protein